MQSAEPASSEPAPDRASSTPEPAGDENLSPGAGALPAAPPAEVPSYRFRPGKHYRELSPSQPTSSPPDKIEVAEVFWYGCPHCYAFEPYLTAWAETRPEDVAFVRIPAIWNPVLLIHARAFYTAEALEVLDEVHEDFFKAIHERGDRLMTEDALASLFAEHGVAESAFRTAFSSPAVETAVQRAAALNRRYRISSTPTLVIDGRYVTGPGQTDGFPGLIAVIDELIARVREVRARQ